METGKLLFMPTGGQSIIYGRTFRRVARSEFRESLSLSYLHIIFFFSCIYLSFFTLDFNNYHFNHTFPRMFIPLISFSQSTSLKIVFRPVFLKDPLLIMSLLLSNTSIDPDSFTWPLMISWPKYTFPVFRSWSRVESYHNPTILEVFGNGCSQFHSLSLSLQMPRDQDSFHLRFLYCLGP